MEKLTRRSVFRMAWPIILANVTVPLMGLVDTAILGRMGNVTELAALAPGTMLFNFVYWTFGFLRMGTTGFVARDLGRNDHSGLQSTIIRSLLIAISTGLVLILLQWPIVQTALYLLGASEEVEMKTASYFVIRIYAAPASLTLFVIMGSLIALGKSQLLLWLQLVLNGLNAFLDVLFTAVYGMGIEGVALGTAAAAWFTAILGLFLLYREVSGRPEATSFSIEKILDRKAILEMIRANSDIMVRTLFLILGFAWFTDQSARYGDGILAANHILLQFISFSAFFLDGFAFTAETLVGQAAGAGQQNRFRRAVWLTTEISAMASIMLSLGFFFYGRQAAALLTDIDSVQYLVGTYLPYVTIYILLSFIAFELDGIFTGSVQTTDMRNTAIVSFAGFLFSSWVFQDLLLLAEEGLWMAFILFVVFRGLTLTVRYRWMEKRIFTHSAIK